MGQDNKSWSNQGGQGYQQRFPTRGARGFNRYKRTGKNNPQKPASKQEIKFVTSASKHVCTFTTVNVRFWRKIMILC